MSSYNPLEMKEIVKNYDALIFDIWGVLYDGVNPYPGAIEYLNSLIASEKKVIFLSNTPRPSSIARDRFISWGVDMSDSIVYTSGDAVREQLISWSDDIFKSLGKKFYHLGAERNEDLLFGLPDVQANMVGSIEEADFVLATVFFASGEDLDVYDDLLKKALDLDLPVVCGNPDVTVCHGDSIGHCAGLIGKKYKEIGGVVHYYGKPDRRVFDTILEKYLSDIDKRKILMIGDTLETDVLGATRVGIDSALVLTGNGEETARRIHAGLEDIFSDQPAVPTWISPKMA